jgi:hypothetical protein
MDEILNTPEKELEPGESRSPEQQALNDATHDPGPYVEQTGDYRQAEAIQNSLISILDNASKSAGEVGVIPIPLPSPAEQGLGEGKSPARENLGATPQPIPQPADGSLTGGMPGLHGGLEQASTMPIPIPIPQSESQNAADSQPGQQGPVEATPITLPAERIQPEMGEEGHPPEPPDLDHSPFPEEMIAALEPDSLAGSMPSLRGDLDQVMAGTDDGRHDATPIPLPGQQGPIDATPIPLPGSEGIASQPAARDDLDQATSGSGESGKDDATPINLPGPQVASIANFGATPQPIPRPEEEGLIGNQPRVRDDLDQTTMSGGDEPGGSGATPINLPGSQTALLDPDRGPKPPGQSALPLDGEVQVSRRFSWEADKGEEKSAGTPKQPLQEAAQEKPILNQELEDLDAGLGHIDDLDSLIPEPGKLENAPGEESPKQDLLRGMPGLEGFEGGPADLKNDAGMGPGMDAGKGHEIPGWESPFPPGKGPNAGRETTEGGKSKNNEPLRDTKLQEYLEDEKAQKQVQDSHDAEMQLTSPIHTSGQGPSPDGDKILQAARDAYKPAQVDDPEMPSNLKDVDPDMGSKKDPNVPLREQMEGEKINPKFDQDQISNYPEDHTKGNQGGGKLSEQYAESLKRMAEATAEKNAKVASTKPKDKAEQVTDPPEPQPGKKSETSGKSG